jgi:hypothetical protein
MLALLSESQGITHLALSFSDRDGLSAICHGVVSPDPFVCDFILNCSAIDWDAFGAAYPLVHYLKTVPPEAPSASHKVPLLINADRATLEFQVALDLMFRRFATLTTISGGAAPVMSNAEMIKYVNFCNWDESIKDSWTSRLERFVTPQRPYLTWGSFLEFYVGGAASFPKFVWSDLAGFGFGPDLQLKTRVSPWKQRGVTMISKLSDASLNSVLTDGTTAIFWAVRNLHIESLQAMLLRLPAIVLPDNLKDAMAQGPQTSPLREQIDEMIHGARGWLDEYHRSIFSTMAGNPTLHTFPFPVFCIIHAYAVPAAFAHHNPSQFSTISRYVYL